MDWTHPNDSLLFRVSNYVEKNPVDNFVSITEHVEFQVRVKSSDEIFPSQINIVDTTENTW